MSTPLCMLGNFNLHALLYYLLPADFFQNQLFQSFPSQSNSLKTGIMVKTKMKCHIWSRSALFTVKINPDQMSYISSRSALFARSKLIFWGIKTI